METSQIGAPPGLNIVRATSLEALQMSHTEFLAGFVGVSHWDAAAQESVPVCVHVSRQGRSCGTVEVKQVTQ